MLEEYTIRSSDAVAALAILRDWLRTADLDDERRTGAAMTLEALDGADRIVIEKSFS